MSLMNDDNFHHDCARYVEDLQNGFHDKEWLEQAFEAHEMRNAGVFDEFLMRRFEKDWDVRLPDDLNPAAPTAATPSSLPPLAAEQDGDGESESKGPAKAKDSKSDLPAEPKPNGSTEASGANGQGLKVTRGRANGTRNKAANDNQDDHTKVATKDDDNQDDDIKVVMKDDDEPASAAEVVAGSITVAVSMPPDTVNEKGQEDGEPEAIIASGGQQQDGEPEKAGESAEGVAKTERGKKPRAPRRDAAQADPPDQAKKGRKKDGRARR